MSLKLKGLSLFAAALAIQTCSSVHALQLKIATNAPDGLYLREMRAAGETIKTQTQGRVEFKFFPGGVMGVDAPTVLRKIKLGQLQGGAFSATELSSVSPDGSIYGLPFFFKSKAEFDFVVGKTLPLIQESYAKSGFIAPGFCGGGFAYLVSSKPLTSLEDLRATKVWAPVGDPIAEVGFRITGAPTVQLAIGDVYPSLQTGGVETVGGPLPAIIAFQWHTKVKFLADVPLAATTGLIVFDKKVINKISAADQLILNAELAKAFKRQNDANFDDAAARAALIKQGIQVNQPNAEQLLAWQSIGEKSLEQLKAKNTFTPAVLAAVLAARAEYRAKNP